MSDNYLVRNGSSVLLGFVCLSTAIALAGQNSSQPKRQLMPPSQGVAPAIVTADSGRKVSGTGNQWSRWYRVGVGKGPTGYTLYRVEFWLSGDRSCGAGAECREVVKNDRQVLWEFRLQGHEEPGAPPKNYSVAHMRVLYLPQQ